MRSRVVRTGVRAALAATALAAVLASSACGPSRFGSAAIVGDQRVPISRVDQIVRYQQSQQDQSQQQQATSLTTQVVQQMVYYLLVDELARQEGVTATQGNLDTTFAKARQASVDQTLEQAKQARAQKQPNVPSDAELTKQVTAQFDKVKSAPDFEDQVRAVYAQDVLIKRYQDDPQNPKQLDAKLSALAKRVGVQVNPRYGSFDARTLRVTAGGGGLFTPAPQSSAGGGIQAP